ncbi:unnamed protein product [Acanthoscelides obtectus]|nr:unnamed protein product [Acanthoscelides obtectus]CAK1666771.1 hypothetical protein AOBTE_LOCUS25480 [Acanthoscelides obtectus]
MPSDAELSNHLDLKESTDPPGESTNETTTSSPEPSTCFDPNVVQIIYKLSRLPDTVIKRYDFTKNRSQMAAMVRRS